MTDFTIAGKQYRTTREVAGLWGLDIKTIQKYANPKNGVIPGCIKQDGVILIPSNAIRPITQPIAQGLLWAIIHIKNDQQGYLDLTKYGIDNVQLHAVLSELKRKLYIDIPTGCKSERERLLLCRITDKGFGLVQYKKKLQGTGRLREKITRENIALAFAAAQTIMQAIQLGTL